MTPWLHIGIAGNEKADRLANDGTGKQKVEIDVGLELKEAYNMADEYCAKSGRRNGQTVNQIYWTEG